MARVTPVRVGPPSKQQSDCPKSMQKICREIAAISGWSVNDVWKNIKNSAILFGTSYYDYARYALEKVKFNAILRSHLPPA